MAKSVSTPQSTSQIKPTDLVRFHDALQKWYQAHGRHSLPWRNTDDPYRIWLSEVMLQQTQVATVLARFYHPFLEKFPRVEVLAAAPREAVMKAWEGLGYYRRAGNLHEAAQSLVAASLRGHDAPHPQHPKMKGRSNPSAGKAQRWIASLNARDDGVARVTLPSTVEGLLTLPGIGRNTAHAIAAFAYHQPVAILEANVKRVVARVFALETPSEKELWARAEALLNRAHPFDYNQAMMDLGSMICTPKNPKCKECPANNICKGKASPERYPAPKVKKAVPTREVLITVREDFRGRLLLERRDAALLGGLYGFPQAPVTASEAKQSSKQLRHGLRPRDDAHYLGTVTHVYSHFNLIGHVVHERIASTPNSPDWHTREEIRGLPLSKLDHKVLALVEACNSSKKKATKAKRKG